MRTVRPLVPALLLLAALACGREAAVDASDETLADVARVAPAPTDASAGLTLAARAVAGGVAEQAAAPPFAAGQGPIARDSAGRPMLIRTGHVSVRVDSLEPAMAAVRRLAASLGGVVGNVSVSAGEQQVRSATLELRIPAARFDEAMGGLAPIGRVEHSDVSAQDVGEEYVDLSARTANARRLEARLIDLLATRTGKLEDVLAVERELARVREEIERHEGRLRWLGARVATSTIQVTVSEPAPMVAEHPGQSVIGRAFVQAWRNFVGLVAWAIASMGVLLPAAAVLWVAARWWRGRRGRRAEA